MLFSFFVFVCIHISCAIQPTMRVSEEPVCIYLFWQNPVVTSLYLRYPFSCRTASELRLLIYKNSVILLLCRVFKYLCTYDLYGPVLNVFDACVGKKITLFSFSSLLTFPWKTMHVLFIYLFCYFYGFYCLPFKIVLFGDCSALCQYSFIMAPSRMINVN
jgi:hypothetical protein